MFSKGFFSPKSYCFIFLIWFLLCSFVCTLSSFALLLHYFLFCVCISFTVKQTAWDMENKLEKNEYSDHLTEIIEEHEILFHSLAY